jgi:hypothetical protein
MNRRAPDFEYLDPVVAGISGIQQARFVIDDQTVQVAELAWPAALASIGRKE